MLNSTIGCIFFLGFNQQRDALERSALEDHEA
jgi:hypothetical protein